MRRYTRIFVCVVSLCAWVSCSPVLSAQTTTESSGSSTSSESHHVSCVVDFEPVSLTPFGFAMATLKSLGSARYAVSNGTRAVDELKKTGDRSTLITEMTRSFKLSTNNFICAKRAVQPFTSEVALSSLPLDQRRRIRMAASGLVVAYDKRIAINDQALQVIKKFASNLPGNGNTADLNARIDAIQAHSGKVWDDLVPPVGMSALLLIDLRGTDGNGSSIKTSAGNTGYTERLAITRAQRQMTLDWLNQHFPELWYGTSEDKISDSAKTAKLYLNFFDGRVCSDEPALSAANSAVGNRQ